MLKSTAPALARYLAILFTACVVQAQASEPAGAAPSSARVATSESGRVAASAPKAGQAPAKGIPVLSTKSSATTPLPGKTATRKDMWEVVGDVNKEALGGARNSHTYRSQSNAKSAGAKDSATTGKSPPSATGKPPTPPKKKKDER